eukprot:5892743-Heterocapsa_arctica.AAC.1
MFGSTWHGRPRGRIRCFRARSRANPQKDSGRLVLPVAIESIYARDRRVGPDIASNSNAMTIA